MNIRNLLKVYGKPLSILVFSVAVALPLSQIHAQYGTAEELSCTAAGGTYYLNVDCNSGGLPPGFMSSCWICDPAPVDPFAWCTVQGGTPIWNVIDAQMAGGYWDCYVPYCTNGSSGPYPGCPLPQPTCADLGQVGTYPSCSTAPPALPATCADTGQVGTYPACSPPPVYSESTYAPPPYTQSTYVPGYSQSTYAPVGCGTPAATLTAAPTRVRSGQTSTLTLTATGVTTSCSITGPGVNTTVAASSCGVSKTLVTPAITSQVTYRVTCDSTVDIAKIIVNLVPKVTEF